MGFKEPFEIVVLGGSIQEAMSDAARAKYRQTAIAFDAVIRKHGGRTALLWLPAVVKPNPLADSDCSQDEDMMLSVGNEIGALIIPVGLAYRSLSARPGIKLQMGYDGSHPTLAGQYLAGAVVYGSLYGKSAVGNPTTTSARSTRTPRFRAEASRMKRCGNSMGVTRGRVSPGVSIRRVKRQHTSPISIPSTTSIAQLCRPGAISIPNCGSSFLTTATEMSLSTAQTSAPPQ